MVLRWKLNGLFVSSRELSRVEVDVLIDVNASILYRARRDEVKSSRLKE